MINKTKYTAGSWLAAGAWIWVFTCVLIAVETGVRTAVLVLVGAPVVSLLLWWLPDLLPRRAPREPLAPVVVPLPAQIRQRRRERAAAERTAEQQFTADLAERFELSNPAVPELAEELAAARQAAVAVIAEQLAEHRRRLLEVARLADQDSRRPGAGDQRS